MPVDELFEPFTLEQDGRVFARLEELYCRPTNARTVLLGPRPLNDISQAFYRVSKHVGGLSKIQHRGSSVSKGDVTAFTAT